MIAIIAAITRDHVLGKNNQLLWSIPSEMKHFRETTKHQTVIMGRKTFESIGRPLPNRHNIVVSASQATIPGALVASSLAEALEAAKQFGTDIYVIGGASIYTQALPLVEKLIISYVSGRYVGDAHFPTISEHDWKIEQRTPHGEFELVVYTRR